MQEQDRQALILASSQSIFLRYGFSRATMGELARAAGVSRPTLYQSFPSKESLLIAVIEARQAALLADLRTRLPELPDRQARLKATLERWAVADFALRQLYPDAGDLITGPSDSAPAQAAAARGRHAVEALLADEILGLDPLRGPKAMLLVATARGLGLESLTVDQYRERLEQAIAVVLRA